MNAATKSDWNDSTKQGASPREASDTLWSRRGANGHSHGETRQRFLGQMSASAIMTKVLPFCTLRGRRLHRRRSYCPRRQAKIREELASARDWCRSLHGRLRTQYSGRTRRRVVSGPRRQRTADAEALEAIATAKQYDAVAAVHRLHLSSHGSRWP
jgi:hypothetical protein